ncbi:porin family protein [Aminobacter aminovorans]|uniref:outer membrane protein n=1 Tax=Aminobacter aminovorans TaxID=83263 RepID=UPI002855A2CD|nr:porin family protein [Aminobacter aminovorans]MDR7221713.1 outer membrane immunogenic protein [Aminobacter aminovorans]
MKTVLLASTFLLAVAGSAFAADVVAHEPAPAAAPAGFVWTGGYVGLHGGYAWLNGTVDVATAERPFDIDGFDNGLLGVHAGYNWQLNGNFVAGVEADISHTWTKRDLVVRVSVPDFLPMDIPVEAGTNWQGSARLRVGYAMDRTLIFATGGVGFANTYVKMQAYDESKTFLGWTAGAGIEHAFTDNWIGRFEYRYADFGSEAFPGGINIDLKEHTVRAGISYKF